MPARNSWFRSRSLSSSRNRRRRLRNTSSPISAPSRPPGRGRPARHLPIAVPDPVDAAHVAEIEIAQLLPSLDADREDLGRRDRSIPVHDLESAAEHRVYDQPPRGSAAAQLGAKDRCFPRWTSETMRRAGSSFAKCSTGYRSMCAFFGLTVAAVISLFSRRGAADPEGLQLGQLGHADTIRGGGPGFQMGVTGFLLDADVVWPRTVAYCCIGLRRRNSGGYSHSP